jgi:ArsR family transcriptional regulator
MDADEYRRMAAAGATHWWYRCTRGLLSELLGPHLSAVDGSTPLVLDAAGGTGATGGWMTERAVSVLADIEPLALVAARELAAPSPPAHPLAPVLTDLLALPFAEGSFDAVLCVTALYHRLVADPAAVVADFARVTRPGGTVCLMEPGVRRLRRGHDAVTHTARRFSVGDMRRLAEGAGLEVVRATGAYSFLVAPAAVLALVERGEPQSDVGRNDTGMRGVLPALAGVERRLLRRVDIPFGLSAIVLARKPG